MTDFIDREWALFCAAYKEEQQKCERFIRVHPYEPADDGPNVMLFKNPPAFGGYTPSGDRQ